MPPKKYRADGTEIREGESADMAVPPPSEKGGFFELIGEFLKFIFGIIFGKNGEEPEAGEDVGDPNAAPLSAVEKIAISRTMVAEGMAQKWQAYKTAHKGERVSLHSPVEGVARVTSPFGPRRAPKAGASTNHQGVDLVAPNGSDKILAAEDGIVLFADRAGKSGITLTIGHADGSTTVYRHLKNQAELPRLGTEVHQGQIVGSMGNTGNSTGKHLHFEHRDAEGVAHNPRFAGAGNLAKGAVLHSAGAQGDARYAGVDPRHYPKLSVTGSQIAGNAIAPFKPSAPQNQRG